MLIGSIRSTLRMRDEERKRGKEERQKLCHFPQAEKLNDWGIWWKIEWQVVRADKELMKWEDIYIDARKYIYIADYFLDGLKCLSPLG